MNTPKPFTKNQLGALYYCVELTLNQKLDLLPEDVLHNALMLKDLVRQHFIYLGGDPKELEE